MRKALATVSVCLLSFLLAAEAHAGGQLENIDITGAAPSPLPGHLTGKVIGIKHDKRALPVSYSINTTLDPIPNPLGPAFLTVTDARTALQQSMDTWNNIRSSFASMRIDGTSSDASLRGFDFVNELTFRTAASFGAIASSPSVSLMEDMTLAHGTDVDEDGDADVSNAISVASDADGDGDREFPAGFYKAGTILDNDVQFNAKSSNGFRFTVDPAAADTVANSVDLNAIAVHEFGHSLGLSHSMVNQLSATDGTGATMFPFIDTGDPTDELAIRSPETDDAAFASFVYPEGSASSGPPALQTGDVAFSAAYGLVKGNLRHGALGQPIAGGSLAAVNAATGKVGSSAYSGTTELSFDPATGALVVSDPAFNIRDGQYTIPVPPGTYKLGAEPVDGQPVSATSVNNTTQIGDLLGQQNFLEQFFKKDPNADPADVTVRAGRTTLGIDLTTENPVVLEDYGSQDFIGFTAATAGTYYAVRIPKSRVEAVKPGRPIAIRSMQFATGSGDKSVVPVFAEAFLTRGSLNPDGTAAVDLSQPLAKTYGFLGSTGFIGQDNDHTPHYFRAPRLLGAGVRYGMAHGLIEDLFLVLRLPLATPFPGANATPPLIGLDGGVPENDVPIANNSFRSTDGITFTPVPNFNYRFALVVD